MPVVACPQCGEDEELTGRPRGESIILTCEVCDAQWDRDTRLLCGLCGSEEIEGIPTSTLQDAGRGDQRTPTGIRLVYYCFACQGDDVRSSTPLPGPQPPPGNTRNLRALRGRPRGSDGGDAQRGGDAVSDEPRLAGVLPGLALGDALGAPFEGRRRIAHQDVEAWLTDTRPLRWTDDTHMALALGRTLRDRRDRLDPQVLGDAFARAYADEPWRGYGAGPPRIFAMAARGRPYVEAAASLFAGGGSFGNGAALRVAPVALVADADPERAADLAEQSAVVTHAHPEAIDGAVAIAQAVTLLGAAPRERQTHDVLEPLEARMRTPALARGLHTVLAASAAGDPREAARRLGTGLPAREAVPAAVAAFCSAPRDASAALVAAITLGGDTDTIAAMAGALAGAFLGAGALPAAQLARLEAHEEIRRLGLDLCRAQAGR